MLSGSEGCKGGVVGEVVGFGPRGRFGAGDECVLGVKEAVEMVANAAEVVDGEGEEKNTLGVDFGNEIGVGPRELCSCARVVCLGENWYFRGRQARSVARGFGDCDIIRDAVEGRWEWDS
jgi:hypothetical protein